MYSCVYMNYILVKKLMGEITKAQYSESEKNQWKIMQMKKPL